MPARILLLSLLCGAAGGGLTAWALGAVGGETPPAAPAPVERARGDAGDAPAVEARPPLVRLPDPGPTLQGSSDAEVGDGEPLAGRVEELEAQLAALRQQVAIIEQGMPKLDLKSLSDDELKARADTMYAFRNYAGTLAAYEALLARDPDLDVDAKGQILSAVAQCHRALGDLEKADEVFRQVEALHGEGSAGAMTARYQRAWLKHAQNDLAGARDLMRQVATSENSPTFWRLFSRANAADFSIRLGDTANVREDLEEFRAELAEDDTDTGRRVRDYVARLLEQLDE